MIHSYWYLRFIRTSSKYGFTWPLYRKINFQQAAYIIYSSHSTFFHQKHAPPPKKKQRNLTLRDKSNLMTLTISLKMKLSYYNIIYHKKSKVKCWLHINSAQPYFISSENVPWTEQLLCRQSLLVRARCMTWEGCRWTWPLWVSM